MFCALSPSSLITINPFILQLRNFYSTIFFCTPLEDFRIYVPLAKPFSFSLFERSI